MPKKHHQQQHHHRTSKRHRSHARASEPSSDFLAALEAQRAKQADPGPCEAPTTPAPIAAPSVEPKAIPGFYYDPAKKKYFPGSAPAPPPSTPQHDVAPFTARKVISSILHLRRREVGGYPFQRHVDLLQLLQRPPHVIEHCLPLHGAAIRVAFSSKCQHVTVVSDGGRLGTFRPRRSNIDPRSLLEVAVASRKASYTNVGCMRYQPGPTTADTSISVTALGGANKSGFLRLLSPVTLAPIYKLKAIDAWHHVWHPAGSHVAVSATFTSVRHAARAHVVDVAHGAVTHGPTSSTVPSSDVFAQSYPTSTSVLNGTRSGHVWLWDLRANDAAFSHSIVTPTAPASVCALHVLSDDTSFLAATTAGAVHRWDARRLDRPVMMYSSDRHSHHHSRSVDLAVSQDEQVVAVSSANVVKVWSLRDRTQAAASAVSLPAPVVSMRWADPHDDGRSDGGMRLRVGTPRAVHVIKYGTER